MALPETDSTMERLLEAAFRVLVERGWAGGSVRDIARLTGVAPGLLYHYFGSKQGLLLAVVDRYNQVPALTGWLASRVEQPATVVLPALAREMDRLFTERGGMLPLVVGEAQVDPVLRERCMGLMSEAVGAIAGFLEARVRAGELREHNARVVARTFLATLQVSRLAGAFEEVVNELPGLLLHGLLAEASGPAVID